MKVAILWPTLKHKRNLAFFARLLKGNQIPETA